MKSMNYEVGILLCGEMRDFLNRCKFNGAHIEYLESSGWIARTFTIKGTGKDLTLIKQALEEFEQ